MYVGSPAYEPGYRKDVQNATLVTRANYPRLEYWLYKGGHHRRACRILGIMVGKFEWEWGVRIFMA